MERRDRMACEVVYTLNALTLLRAHDDPAYAAVLARADLSVADGVGCVWALQHWTGRRPERVTGLELIDALCTQCVSQNTSVFLLGARPGVAQRAATCLEQRFPGLRVAGVKEGFWPVEQEAEVVAGINASGAGLLLVALGQPRQEVFLDTQRPHLRARLGVGVGGCFDVLAGDLPLAPRWVRRAGLEWLFRLWQEPWRFQRVRSLPRFVCWVLFGRGL
jgi:N-acetylglucosaminyldiphosphoundecaprenol N-acetyl-beta-D-mannosaminyltransferase